MECVANLRCIDGAKKQWGLAHKKNDGEATRQAEVNAWIGDVANDKRHSPKCPAGGTYSYGRVGELPKSWVTSRVLP